MRQRKAEILNTVKYTETIICECGLVPLTYRYFPRNTPDNEISAEKVCGSLYICHACGLTMVFPGVEIVGRRLQPTDPK
jgi:hypothetical protein